MKLVIAIVHAEDAGDLVDALTDKEYRVTRLHSSGGFLKQSNASVLVGVEEQGLGLDYADRFREGIARVTAADVQRAAERYLLPETFAVVTVGTPAPVSGAR